MLLPDAPPDSLPHPTHHNHRMTDAPRLLYDGKASGSR